ncbi:hypothetical protein B0H67DRAFT_583937 [Lasiosphaeris hirsuta]|uniref:Uncharacterized protein n=1 Tax=Lasiosphaeris hirsuta TaxID=260670 RepID=A0AA40DRV1_9PEZI|nr:hypothetical protein B0H67DRAFT_583937 [Lasiosphaeris hirsuta]
MRIHLQYSPRYRPTSHKPSRPFRPQRPKPSKAPPPPTPHTYDQLLRDTVARNTQMTHPGWSPASPTLTTMHADDLEASRLEIALLALGVLALVVQMSLLMYVGVRRRARSVAYITLDPLSPSPPDPHARLSQPCLWREAFGGHPSGGHGLLLLGPGRDGGLVERLRKASEEAAGVLGRELGGLRRKMTMPEVDPAMKDVEVGVVNSRNGYADRTGADVSGWCARRHSSFVPEKRGEFRV